MPESDRPAPRGAVVHGGTGEILSPADIDSELLRLTSLLEDATYEFRTLAEDAARKKHAWEKAHAGLRVKARAAGGLGPGGRCTDAEAEDAAILGADVAYLDKVLSEEILKAQKALLDSLSRSLDTLRTLAANLRAQV